MSKRIVFLSQYYPPEMGAPQSRLFETINGLRSLGWDVMVVTAMPNYPTGKIFTAYRYKLWYTEQQENVSIFRTWLYASNSKKTIPRVLSMLSFSLTCLLSLLKIRKFKPQIILTESPPLTLALSGLLLSKLSSCKHILNISDIWPLSAHELGALKKGLLYNTLERLEQFVYRASDAGTGQSGEITEHLSKKGMHHVHLYRNGVDASRFTTTARNIDNKPLKIVYAGLLGVAQGIYQLSTQINYASLNAELHIYGDGAERNDIENFARTSKHSTGIYFHGSVSRNEIPDILTQYSCTIIPLVKPIYGAVPSKIYEAMAAGLPILFAGGGEGAAIIEEHKCGWTFTPGDFRSIETLVQNLNGNSQNLLKEISDNCKYAATHIFDRKIQIESLDYFLTSHAYNNRSRSKA